MGAETSLAFAVSVYSVSSIVGGLSTLPGGLGGFEGACIGLLVAQGVPIPVAVAATAVIRVGTLWFSILVGFICLPGAMRHGQSGYAASSEIRGKSA